MDVEQHPPANPELDWGETGADPARLAIDRLRELTGWTVELQEADGLHDRQIRVEWQGGVHEIPIQVKVRVTPATLGVILERFDPIGPQPILVTRHVTPPLGTALRDRGINYLDTVGNAYLNLPLLYLLVDGRRLAKGPELLRPEKILNTGGIKILFLLLCQPHFIRLPLRKIAEAAGVALGTAQYVVKELERHGRLFGEADQRRLRDPEALINRWVEAYLLRLRPKQIVGRYRAADPDWWKETDLGGHRAIWGGEVAGALLTSGYLRPGTVTVYAEAPPNRLIAERRLKRDAGGEVEILRRFWPFVTDPDATTAPPLLVYADLLGVGDTRTAETAAMIRERYLARADDPTRPADH